MLHWVCIRKLRRGRKNEQTCKTKQKKENVERKAEKHHGYFPSVREAMKANRITPSQRQIIRDILRPVLHDLEGEVRDVSCHIQEELEKRNQENK
ncbi:hypothetical protein Ro1_00145 [Raoultella phage Ro1]|uniref:Uncharacterized protein n=1 Tax=Raoultella phage Ro1 TaxID=2053702 RepID=A0A2H4YGT2_9CAUD|nr:hypothetical protein HWB37_gp145 [Raoultella phage Ro1]AUE23371.1 hypothetical protein Ro1_00145 [Raoultella phage Ro1]